MSEELSQEEMDYIALKDFGVPLDCEEPTADMPPTVAAWVRVRALMRQMERMRFKPADTTADDSYDALMEGLKG